jgi:hypothetical protein
MYLHLISKKVPAIKCHSSNVAQRNHIMIV